MPDLASGEQAYLPESLREAIRLEVEKAVARMHAAIVSEVRNLILGQANVTHHLTLRHLHSLHAGLHEAIEKTAGQIGEIQRHNTTRLMTTDLMAEMLCLIDQKHQRYERALEEHGQYLKEEICAWGDAIESRLSKLELALERIASRASARFDGHALLVELPFAVKHLAGLPDGSRIIHCGGGESILALTIAAPEHRFYAMDLRQPMEAWEGPIEPVDAVFCISAPERPDLEIMDRFRQWLKPAGLIVLTAPYGPRSVGAPRRTYNSGDIERLFAGWSVLECRYYESSPERRWVPASSTIDQGLPSTEAVVLLAARPE